MAVTILEVKRESCPAARLIGKKYEGSANWAEWWENDWFTTLERSPCLPFNGDAYIGAVHIVDGMPQRWIGMLFPVSLLISKRWSMRCVICMPGRTAASFIPWTHMTGVWKS